MFFYCLFSGSKLRSESGRGVKQRMPGAYSDEVRTKFAHYAIDNGIAIALRRLTADLGKHASETTAAAIRNIDLHVELSQRCLYLLYYVI